MGQKPGKKKAEGTDVHKNQQTSLVEITILSVQNSGVLFTTSALTSAAERFDASLDEYGAAQAEVVRQVVTVAGTYIPLFQRCGRLLAELDTLAAFAETAAVEGWCRPKLTRAFEINDIVEDVVGKDGHA